MTKEKQEEDFLNDVDARKLAGYLKLSLGFRQACLNFLEGQSSSKAPHSKEVMRRYRALLAGAEHLYGQAFDHPYGGIADIMRAHPPLRWDVVENAFLKKAFSGASALGESMMGCVTHARSVADHKDIVFESVLKDQAWTNLLSRAYPRVFEGVRQATADDFEKKSDQGRPLTDKTKIAMSILRDPEVIRHLPEETVAMLDQKSPLKKMLFLFFLDQVEDQERQKCRRLKEFEARLGLF